MIVWPKLSVFKLNLLLRQFDLRRSLTKMSQKPSHNPLGNNLRLIEEWQVPNTHKILMNTSSRYIEAGKKIKFIKFQW